MCRIRICGKTSSPRLPAGSSSGTRLLADRRIRYVLIAPAASGSADGFLPVAQSFAVLQVTGSAGKLGIVLACQSLAGPAGGHQQPAGRDKARRGHRRAHRQPPAEPGAGLRDLLRQTLLPWMRIRSIAKVSRARRRADRGRWRPSRPPDRLKQLPGEDCPELTGLRPSPSSRGVVAG